MGKIKVVLDTNILISLLFKKTLTEKFLKIVEEGKVEIYASEDILKELTRVLTYTRIKKMFEKYGIDSKSALESLLINIKIVKPKIKINLIKEDPEDNKFLECGIEAKARYIVSGDKHLLKIRKFKNMKIVTAREFLEIF